MPGSYLAGHYSTNGAINSSIQANLRLDSQRRSLTGSVGQNAVTSETGQAG